LLLGLEQGQVVLQQEGRGVSSVEAIEALVGEHGSGEGGVLGVVGLRVDAASEVEVASSGGDRIVGAIDAATVGEDMG
jgi:hypothetical protein